MKKKKMKEQLIGTAQALQLPSAMIDPLKGLLANPKEILKEAKKKKKALQQLTGGVGSGGLGNPFLPTMNHGLS